MKAIVNTEIQDLPENFSITLGKDKRGFKVILNMTITKKTQEYYGRRSARDIYLNELNWYYEVRFNFDSDMLSYQYANFDLQKEDELKAYKEWYHDMTNYDKYSFPYFLQHTDNIRLFDVIRRGYKEIFSEMYVDGETLLKIMRASKRAADNNQQCYTYKQKKVVEKVASYYRTRIDRVDKYNVQEALEKAGLENDRDFDVHEEYLVSVVSNSRIENLIDLIPVDMKNIGFGLDIKEMKERVQRFVENRKKKNDRKNAINSILQ